MWKRHGWIAAISLSLVLFSLVSIVGVVRWGMSDYVDTHITVAGIVGQADQFLHLVQDGQYTRAYAHYEPIAAQSFQNPEDLRGYIARHGGSLSQWQITAHQYLRDESIGYGQGTVVIRGTEHAFTLSLRPNRGHWQINVFHIHR